jgi:sugar transferase (PEP-CTERM system associated)
MAGTPAARENLYDFQAIMRYASLTMLHAPSPPETPSPDQSRPRGPARATTVLTAGRALLVLDMALLTLAWPVAAWLAIAGPWPGWLALVAYPVALLTFLFALGLYRRESIVETRRSITRLPLALTMGAGAATVATLLLPPPFGGAPGARLFIAALLCGMATASVSRAVMFAAHRRGRFRRRLLIFGAGQRAWDLMWLLRKEGRTLAYDITFVHVAALGPIDPRLADDPACDIITAAEDLAVIAHERRADQIVVAADERRGMPMHALLECRTAGFPVHEYLAFLEKEIGRVDLKRLELGWLLYADGFAFNPAEQALKRALDVAVSAVLLAIALLPLVVAAAAIKLTDRGPVLYRQDRVTRHGRVFRILKLRTMTTNSEATGAVWAAERDPRITRIGHGLRRTRLDELPQLINILRGDMSFVGPRPERPEFTRELAAKLPLYEERHIVRAGLTGWAQINYPYGASLDDARSKLSYDLYYVKNFGILFDVLIILQTARVVLWPSGVR